jgi:cell division septal protein FtsQ
LLIAVWYGVRLQSLTINEISVEGGETISHKEIQAQTELELQGSYFLIIPKGFAYLYPHDRIVSVVERIPRVHSVEVSRSSQTALAIAFKEYVPHSLWCVHERPDVPCFYADSQGYAFEEAPPLTGGSLVRHNVEGMEEIKEGHMIDPAQLAALYDFLKRLEAELKFRVSTIVHKKDKDLEFHINGGGMILAASGKSLDTTLNDLRAIIASPEFKHLKPGNFKYIDMRFDSKIFVNEETEKKEEREIEIADGLPEG